MKSLSSVGLCYHDKQLLVLNQQKLPAVCEWIICQSPTQMVEIIQSLQIRGAPLIGIAAALALADYVEHGADSDAILQAATQLKAARPTAVNLSYCIDRQWQAFINTGRKASIIEIAEDLFIEDAQLSTKVADHGEPLINDADHILTHCNTGSLVTTGIGTALGVIKQAYQNGKKLHVYVDETRPLLQGARLTTWELDQAHIPHTLICDNMAASLMRAKKIQKIIVGADRIARNGDFANKIGTYHLAVLAQYHQIPFYVAAPFTTIDLNCHAGHEILIEQRAADEVRGASGHFGKIIWSPPETDVYNPAFDITPAQLVTAFILDNGVVQSNHFLENTISLID
jgi:methylthioribose-1-phosphate isomerase